MQEYKQTYMHTYMQALTFIHTYNTTCFLMRNSFFLTLCSCAGVSFNIFNFNNPSVCVFFQKESNLYNNLPFFPRSQIFITCKSVFFSKNRSQIFIILFFFSFLFLEEGQIFLFFEESNIYNFFFSCFWKRVRAI